MQAPLATVPRNATMKKNWEETNALNNKTRRRRSDAVGARARHFAGSSGRLSGPSGQDRGALRASRTDRRNGTPDRAEAVGEPETAVLYRKSPGRRRQHRDDAGRKVSAGRLHHPGRELELRGQSEPLRQEPL